MHAITLPAVCSMLAMAYTAFAAETKDVPKPPPAAFQLRGFELLHPFTNLRTVPVSFPLTDPVTSVEQVATLGGKVWAIARPASIATIPAGSGQLWEFSPVENHLTRLGDWFENRFPSGLRTFERSLWVTAGEAIAGVGALDVDKMNLQYFGATLGLPSPDCVGFGFASKSLFTFSRDGIVYRLGREGTTWKRLPNSAPGDSRGAPDHWAYFDGSGDWLIALHDQRAAVRHTEALDWTDLPAALHPAGPGVEEAKVHAVQGDGGGGFWVGTDAGLYRILAETGSSEERLHTFPVSIRGGWSRPIPKNFQASQAMLDEANNRIKEQVRLAMLQRVRYARASQETGRNLNPVSPTSRVPGGVTALMIDHGFLWVATTDGPNPTRGRIQVMHLSSHKWLGWFPVAAPVRSMAADERIVWIGFDVHLPPSRPPMLAVEKAAILAVPAARWSPDAIDAAELESMVAKLPPREQLVYQFFSANYQAVVDSVNTDLAKADDEQLFLLACSYDPIGLNQPAKVEDTVLQLNERFPKSLFTTLAENLRNKPAPEPIPDPIPAPPPAASPAAPPVANLTTPPATFAPPPLAEILKKRDINGDGKISPLEFKLWVRGQFEFKAFDTNNDGFLDGAELDKLIGELYGTAPVEAK